MIAFGLVCLQDLPDPERMADAGLSVSAYAFDLGDLFGEHCFLAI